MWYSDQLVSLHLFVVLFIEVVTFDAPPTWARRPPRGEAALASGWAGLRLSVSGADQHAGAVLRRLMVLFAYFLNYVHCFLLVANYMQVTMRARAARETSTSDLAAPCVCPREKNY